VTTATVRLLTMGGKLGTTSINVFGNGIQTAYLVALVNVVLQLVVSFGVSLSSQQEALIISAVNLVLLIAARAVTLAHRELELRGEEPRP
jgi:hypothetical protein